jgi:hypothetical protein
MFEKKTERILPVHLFARRMEKSFGLLSET